MQPRRHGGASSLITIDSATRAFLHQQSVKARNGEAVHAERPNNDLRNRATEPHSVKKVNVNGAKKPRTAPVAGEGELVAMCWCDRKFVRVTSQDVIDGRTYSCGKKGCGPEVMNRDVKHCQCGSSRNVTAVRVEDALTYLCEQCEQRRQLEIQAENVWGFDRYDAQEELTRAMEAADGLAIPARMREPGKRARPVTMPWSAKPEVTRGIVEQRQLREWAKIPHHPKLYPGGGFYCSCGFYEKWSQRAMADTNISDTLKNVTSHLQGIKEWRAIHNDNGHGEAASPER